MRRDELAAHLEDLARAPAPSGRGRMAKVQALRALDRLNRLSRPRPAEPQRMPEGWRPGPPELVALDAHDPPERRQRWHEELAEEGLLGPITSES